MPFALRSSQDSEGSDAEDALNRDHTWGACIFYSLGLSMCITVDILQYSMPLAFLPSVLEDRGHETMDIAAAIGVYYWTGFAGGVMITSYQIWRVVCGKEENSVATNSTVRRQIVYLVLGLLVGGVTLACQAMWPTFRIHSTCRFIQGLCGAFIFFYTFRLSVQLFKGQQQVFAMTAAATALNVAEVLGSFCGALLFDIWGQRAVFWVLAGASVVNQFILVILIYRLKPSPLSSSKQILTHDVNAPGALASRQAGDTQEGWHRLRDLLKNRRLVIAVIMIVVSAVVKGSVEEMLPFHADHQWGFDPLKIGQLFSIIAVAYIIAAVLTGKLWQYLQRFRIIFAATWLAALGGAAWLVFANAHYCKSERLLFMGLALYGACLGFTHTPAALLLADAIEHEESEASKDAVNGIWNTMWEAGGSLGFLLGGLLAHSYEEQLVLTMSYCLCCVFTGGLLLFLASWPLSCDSRKCLAATMHEKVIGSSYGSMA